MKKKSLLFPLLIVFASILSSQATPYYVKTDGSDSDPGTDTAPFRTIQKALDVAKYGDIINIHEGVYREHLRVPNTVADGTHTGSLSTPLIIQAWDTDGGGIQDYERPTIKGSSAITNWTAVTDTAKWAELTGLTPGDYIANTIYVTPWRVKPSGTQTIIDTVHLAMESDTKALRQTHWGYYSVAGHANYDEVSNPAGPGEFNPGNPRNPLYMTNGTFYYDYTNTNLYVWRSDGQTPGIAYPIEVYDFGIPTPSTVIGAVLVCDWTVDYVYFKGLKFRHSNGTSISTNSNPYVAPIGVLAPIAAICLRDYSTMDYCDVQWMDFQGVSCYGREQGKGCVITNSEISNIGCTGLVHPGEDGRIVDSLFQNNNYRKFPTGWQAAAIKSIAGGPAGVSGMIISGNTFRTNQATALWFDTISGSSGDYCIISNNFIYGSMRDSSSGIALEIASYFNICNNVVVSNRVGIGLEWSSHNWITHNTVHVPYYDPPQDGGAAFGSAASFRNDYLPSGIPPASPESAYNNVAYNIFVSSANQAVIALMRDKRDSDPDCHKVHDNSYRSNLVFNTFQSDVSQSGRLYAPIQLNRSVRSSDCQSYESPVPYTNLDLNVFFSDIEATPGQNVGNFAADPRFYNGASPAIPPTDPLFYELRWNSPAKDYALPLAGAGVAKDFSGHSRDSFPDLGAFELYDTDSDGIADCWELFYAGNLTTYPTGTGDGDGDGVSDVDEYLRDTEPNNNLSHYVTLYANVGTGRSALDGQAASPQSNTKGPKDTIAHAISVSKSQDTIRVASGTYTENVDISSQPISMVIDGSVILN